MEGHVLALILVAVLAGLLVITHFLSSSGKTGRKWYILYIPVLAIPFTWSVFVLLNVLIDENLDHTHKHALWNEVAGRFTQTIDDSQWRFVRGGGSQVEGQLINISHYDSPNVDSYIALLWDQGFNPVLARPQLSDNDIIDKALDLAVARDNGKKRAQVLKSLQNALLPNIKTIRENEKKKNGTVLYLRRVLNGFIQFVTLYCTFIAMGYWWCNHATLRFQWKLISIRSPLKNALEVDGDEEARGKGKLFLKKRMKECRHTDCEDGHTLDVVPIRALDASDELSPNAAIDEAEVPVSVQHHTHPTYSEYQSWNAQRVDYLISKYSLDFSMFHMIKVILERASLNGLVDDAVNAAQHEIEHLQSRLERSSSFLSFWIWLIPTIGFIGTINGISGALESAHTVVSAEQAVRGGVTQSLTSTLGIAFDTTLLALICSIPLMFMQKIHEWGIDKYVQTIHRLLSERVLDGLCNACGVQERLDRHDKMLRAQMKTLEQGLTRAIAELSLSGRS